MECSAGTLLAGRVRYAQPVRGYRTGIEPVLLAAAIPARAGHSVLEAGTGAGAGLLCLAARVPGLRGTGVERDPAMAALARRNFADNGAPFDVMEADATALPAVGPFDHVFANPPWHDPASSQPPDARRAAATHLEAGGLGAWVAGLAPLAASTLTLALPAGLAAEAMGLLHAAGMPRILLFPLWPRPGVEAKLVLVQAERGRGGSRVASGLVLHAAGPGYTAAADAILRDGAALLLRS